jgi:hypothetical protein
VGQGIGVIVLMGMILVSYAILRPVSDEPRRWSGEDAGDVDPVPAPRH